MRSSVILFTALLLASSASFADDSSSRLDIQYAPITSAQTEDMSNRSGTGEQSAEPAHDSSPKAHDEVPKTIQVMNE